MLPALLVVIAAHLLWTVWGNGANHLYITDVLTDSSYFLSTFTAAAVMDYITIQIITSLNWSRGTAPYHQFLVAILSVSVFTHLIGAISFMAEYNSILAMYDSAGVFLLAAEFGVFLTYGMGNLLYRNNDYNKDSGGSV